MPPGRLRCFQLREVIRVGGFDLSLLTLQIRVGGALGKYDVNRDLI